MLFFIADCNVSVESLRDVAEISFRRRDKKPRHVATSPVCYFNAGIRPISLLALSLLTLLESNFPGKSLGNPYGPGNSTP